MDGVLSRTLHVHVRGKERLMATLSCLFMIEFKVNL